MSSHLSAFGDSQILQERGNYEEDRSDAHMEEGNWEEGESELFICLGKLVARPMQICAECTQLWHKNITIEIETTSLSQDEKAGYEWMEQLWTRCSASLDVLKQLGILIGVIASSLLCLILAIMLLGFSILTLMGRLRVVFDQDGIGQILLVLLFFPLTLLLILGLPYCLWMLINLSNLPMFNLFSSCSS